MKYTIACLLLCVGICRSLPTTDVLPSVDDKSWTYLVLAQFWPESSCFYLEQHKDKCTIPSYIQDWTLHGLWPSKPDSTVDPHNCNDSMTFDMNQIKVLKPQLDRYWHNYNKDSEPTYLWSHEWTKHGTCAFSLPDLRGELKYFNKTLQLHSGLNLTEALAKSGVVPSKTDFYNREDIFNAVVKYYKVKPYLVCVWDNTARKAYIDQIYLCYTKTFTLQDCYPTKSKTEPGGSTYFEDCMKQDKIYYLPKATHGNDGAEGPRRQGQPLVFKSENGNHSN